MQDKLKKIKLLLSDVDGVMTDTTIWLDSDGHWKRNFSIYDGMGFKRLQAEGIQVGIITASDALDVRERFKFLKVDHFYEKASDKRPALDDIRQKTGFELEEIAYIGDDIMDVPLLEVVGFSVSVPHALEEVKSKADFITQNPGGHGAVREVCEMILKAKK